ncbi:MAG: LPS-assembly protein LptD, partial [Oscillatoriales cyanobacterium RU_3_3]|nr:LPS-assembly protein LptD [Oscillatoriales cyanobacterium RU_3_3]
MPVTPGDTIEIKADSQEFDDKQQIVTAIGRVIVRFRQAVIDADRAVVNLITRQVVASGNVSYTRGQQVVRGQRMEFNLGLNAGTVEQASGELFLPAAGSDLTPTLPTDISAGTILEQPLSDRITSQQPV